MNEFVGPSQGHTLELASETSLGQQDTFAHIRCDRANSTFATKTRMAMAQPNTHANPADYRDPPTDYQMAQENALSLSLETRKHSATGIPPIMTLLRSGGYSLATQTADAVVSTGSTQSSIVAVGGSGVAVGEAILVQTDANPTIFEPALVVAVNSTTYTTMFEVYNAPTSGYAIKPMYTATPRTGKIDPASGVGLRYTIRAEDGSNNPQSFLYRACAGVLGTTDLSPNTLLKWVFGVHVGDVSKSDGTYTAPTYSDGTRTHVLTGNFRAKLAQGAGATGGLSNVLSGIKSASIEWGHSVKMIQTIGGTGNVNDIQGYVGYCGQPKITMNVIFDAAKWADFETAHTAGSGTNPATAIEFSSQVYASTDPTFLLAFPVCYLLDAPMAVEKDETGYVSATLVYGATAAGLGSATDPDTSGAQSHFIAINNEVA